MSTTIMYARIAPTVTVRHIRHESQDKKAGCPSRLLDYSKSERLAFCQGQSCDMRCETPLMKSDSSDISELCNPLDFISHKCYKNA